MMKFLIIISLSILLSTNLMAASSDATITRMYGKVQLLETLLKQKKGLHLTLYIKANIIM